MKTDILVIGSGGAGLVAACAARRAGAAVTLLTKSKAGLANCTTYAGGGFTLPYGALSPEEHRRMTLETGRYINIPYMLDALSFEASSRVESLREFGVKIDMRDGSASVAKYARTMMMGGTGMTLPLVDYARQAGVKIVENAMVTGLFVDDDAVSGARVLDTSGGSLYSISAKAVIIASGGGGRLYSRTDNPVRTTGDGFALIYELGLPLIDMEFVQFYPMGFAEPDFPIWMIGLNLLDHARVTSSDGVEFLRNKWPEWGIHNGKEANLFTRDRSAIAIASEWAAGKEVFLHLDEMPEKFWESSYGRMLRRMYPGHRPPAAGPIRVKPVQHYFPGGALVNPDCSTEIRGLFACGEVTGGTDGANRIGGNALSMITVFGFRAQAAATQFASGTENRPVPDSHPADGLHKKWSRNSSGPSPREIKKAMNRISDERVSVVRTDKGLESAANEFDEMISRIGEMRATSGEEFMEAYEARNALLVGKMVASAARVRKESRGVHYRHDYPAENDNWQKHLLMRQKNGNMSLEEVPLDFWKQ